MVRTLLKHDADINLQDDNGISALMEAVQADSEDSVSILLEAGADKTLKNSDGKTALDLAVKEGNKVIQSLLSK